MFWDLVRPPRVTLTRAPQCWPLSFFVGTSRRKTPPFNIDGRIQRYSARCQNVGLAFCFNGHFMFFRHRNFQTDTNFIHRVVGNCSFQIRLCFCFLLLLSFSLLVPIVRVWCLLAVRCFRGLLLFLLSLVFLHASIVVSSLPVDCCWPPAFHTAMAGHTRDGLVCTTMPHKQTVIHTETQPRK
jgi:hypothetical protein